MYYITIIINISSSSVWWQGFIYLCSKLTHARVARASWVCADVESSGARGTCHTFPQKYYCFKDNFLSLLWIISFFFNYLFKYVRKFLPLLRILLIFFQPYFNPRCSPSYLYPLYVVLHIARIKLYLMGSDLWFYVMKCFWTTYEWASK